MSLLTQKETNIELHGTRVQCCWHIPLCWGSARVGSSRHLHCPGSLLTLHGYTAGGEIWQWLEKESVYCLTLKLPDSQETGNACFQAEAFWNTLKMQTVHKWKLIANLQLEAEATRSITPVQFILIGFVHFHLKHLNNHTGTSTPTWCAPAATPAQLSSCQELQIFQTSMYSVSFSILPAGSRGPTAHQVLRFWTASLSFSCLRPGITKAKLPLFT